MLDFRVRLMQNPWDHTIPNEELFEIFTRIAKTRAGHVERKFGEGEWYSNNLGLAFLNPAAPMWQPTPETLLATLSIGPRGDEYVVNGIAKASEHRDHGVPAGYGVYMDLAMSRDGDFCWGYSTKVDGMIVGASGQTERQDACEAGHAAVTLLYLLHEARATWKEQRDEPNWFCNKNQPDKIYTSMATQAPIMGVELAA
jgi:hypothetical protein